MTGPSHAGALPSLRVLGPILALAATSVLVGLLAGALAAGEQPALALLFPLLLVPILLWRSPATGVLALFAGTILVEQFAYEVGPRAGAVTASIPLFQSVVAGTGVTPAELLLAAMLLIVVLQCVRQRRRLLHPSPLGRHLLGLCAAVAVYLVLGITRGGDIPMALWEARPFLYLGASFLLASALLGRREHVRILLWTLVLGCGLKAAYGLVIWMSVRSLQPRPEAVLAHEESFFFGLFIFLTIGFWMVPVPGRLRTTATALLPVVLAADMVNSRRTAWGILICGCVAVLAVAYANLPDRRRFLRRLALLLVVLNAVYLPAFWGQNGALAQPARAIRSVIAPDARDEQSNMYRTIEDANLEINIQRRHSTGMGFGIPIDYVIPIVDLTEDNRSIAYVPHNGVLYVWMRMGLVGQVLLWLVIGQMMLIACRAASAKDRETALVGIVAVGAVVGYVVMGDKDMGFSWFRIAFAMGILFGLLEARLRSLTDEAPRPHADALPAASPSRLPELPGRSR